jgi:Protein of unknown function (DUF3800)
MILTSYIDESGTHDSSPIMTMGGCLGTSNQWAGFEADWNHLLSSEGVTCVHAVDLFKRTKQFKGWSADAVKRFAISLDSTIAKHLQLGFSVVIRADDYRSVYKTADRPKKIPLDTKYGCCFRACLAFLPSIIASEFGDLTKDMTINFCLEGGHVNEGDAKRLFQLFKSYVLPEWQNLVGTLEIVNKDSVGAQAADFLTYCIYRAEIVEHGIESTEIENAAYIASSQKISIANNLGAAWQLHRIPITRKILFDLKKDLFALEAEKKALHVPRKNLGQA